MYYGKDANGIEYTEGQRFIYLNQPIYNYTYNQQSNTLEAMHPLLYQPQPTLISTPFQHQHQSLGLPVPTQQLNSSQQATGTVFYPPPPLQHPYLAAAAYPSHGGAAYPGQDPGMFALNHAFTQLSMADSAALVYAGHPLHNAQPIKDRPTPISLSKPVFLGKLSPPSTNGQLQQFQQPLLDRKPFTDSELSRALYFVIKSYSEEDVQRSIRHGIWCSTEHGNRRLDSAYRSLEGAGPLLLFFSVNGSGKFCGVAEMISAVDYAKCSGIWAQTKWRGEFKVRWMIVKDVPNSCLRHIRNETNEDRPVTNSRDATSLPSDKGFHLFSLIKNYKMMGSILQESTSYREVKNGGGSQQPAPTPVK